MMTSPHGIQLRSTTLLRSYFLALMHSPPIGMTHSVSDSAHVMTGGIAVFQSSEASNVKDRFARGIMAANSPAGHAHVQGRVCHGPSPRVYLESGYVS